GRASYARATIIVVDHKFSGKGFTTSTIYVEYEWAPPRCSECKINEFETQMLDGKLMLVDEHGKPLEMKVMNEALSSKSSTSMEDQLVESDMDEVDLPDDETSRYRQKRIL
ncbi:hypothetical protein Tco_0935445, partial [Tanacetum coccineum]